MAAGNTSRYAGLDEDEFDEESNDEAFQVITDESSWRIAWVSPLHNLQYSTVKLKQYASKLKQTLTESVSEKAMMQYQATFAVDEKMKYQADDPHALQITVTARNRDSESANYDVVYKAVLLSWGVFVREDHVTHLPILLDRGLATLTNTVRTVLQKLFDCCITNFTFTRNHMLLLNAQLAEQARETGGGNRLPCISFIYTLAGAEYKEKITVRCDLLSIKRLWRSVCMEGLKDMVIYRNKQFAIELYGKFQNHVLYSNAIDVAMMDLVEIVYPKASVKVNGFIKIKEVNIVRGFLKTINDIFMERRDPRPLG